MRVGVAFSSVGLLSLTACAPAFEVVDRETAEVYKLRTTLCFVGCEVHVTRSDETVCDGFSGHLTEGQAASVVFRCPNEDAMRLFAPSLSRDAPSSAEIVSQQEHRARAEKRMEGLNASHP